MAKDAVLNPEGVPPVNQTESMLTPEPVQETDQLEMPV